MHKQHYEKFADGTIKNIENEIPFDIPDTWCWCRLKDICEINPIVKCEDLKEVSFITMSDIVEGYKSEYKQVNKIWGSVKKNFTHFQNGDVGFAKITPCFQNIKSVVFKNLTNEIGAGTTELHILRSYILNTYLLYFVKSKYFIEHGIKNFTGAVGQQRFGTDAVKITNIPLPPLAEQQRIVNKIEELFAQVDKIEEEKQSLLKLIDKVQDKVLDLGIKGKLVKQDPNDEPASVLLEKIFEEKKKLAKEGKIKLSKDEFLEPKISDDNDYYQDIPTNWIVTKLKNIGIWGAGSTPNRQVKEYYNKGTIPWIKTGELNNNIVLDSEEKITNFALQKCNLRFNKIGNILIAMYGATIGKLGIAGIELTTNQACCGCEPFIYNKYLFFYLMSIKENLIRQGSGGAQPNISKEIIINNYIILPPINEQKRIVDTIENLLNKIEQIKDSL